MLETTKNKKIKVKKKKRELLKTSQKRGKEKKVKI